MLAVASIKTREASAGRLSHACTCDCEREVRRGQRGTAAGTCVVRAMRRVRNGLDGDRADGRRSRFERAQSASSNARMRCGLRTAQTWPWGRRLAVELRKLGARPEEVPKRDWRDGSNLAPRTRVVNAILHDSSPGVQQPDGHHATAFRAAARRGRRGPEGPRRGRSHAKRLDGAEHGGTIERGMAVQHA